MPREDYAGFTCSKCLRHPIFIESTNTWLCICKAIKDGGNEDLPTTWQSPPWEEE